MVVRSKMPLVIAALILPPILYVVLAVPALWLTKEGYLPRWVWIIYGPLYDFGPTWKVIHWALEKLP